MRYSVSATCLNQDLFEENVEALLCFPVADLHCDYFPEISTAPSLSLAQLRWCQQNWPRSLTIHLWGQQGLAEVREILPRGRLLVQLHELSAGELKLVPDAVTAGWETGISVCPELVAPALRSLAIPPAAVQVLSTSKPGCIGGSFVPSAWPAVRQLHGLRLASDGDWSIEVDGGLTPAVLAQLARYCDLAVVGSNYLSNLPELRWQVPGQLLESTWLNSAFTS